MSLDKPPQNKMMTAAPNEKAGFHFAGNGIWHAAYIWALSIEEATKEWLATRKPVNPLSPAEQSTAAPTAAANDGGNEEKD